MSGLIAQAFLGGVAQSMQGIAEKLKAEAEDKRKRKLAEEKRDHLLEVKEFENENTLASKALDKKSQLELEEIKHNNVLKQQKQQQEFQIKSDKEKNKGKPADMSERQKALAKYFESSLEKMQSKLDTLDPKSDDYKALKKEIENIDKSIISLLSTGDKNPDTVLYEKVYDLITAKENRGKTSQELLNGLQESGVWDNLSDHNQTKVFTFLSFHRPPKDKKPTNTPSTPSNNDGNNVDYNATLKKELGIFSDDNDDKNKITKQGSNRDYNNQLSVPEQRRELQRMIKRTMQEIRKTEVDGKASVESAKREDPKLAKRLEKVISDKTTELKNKVKSLQNKLQELK